MVSPFSFGRSISALCLLLGPAAAQAVRPSASGGAAAVDYGAPPPLERLADASQLSRHASSIGFDRLRKGAKLSEPIGVYGVRLRFGERDLPEIWYDPTPRSLPLQSRSAIGNADSDGGPKRFVKGDPEDVPAMRATFVVPVNRVGFEVRRLDGTELNVILRAFSGGREIGSLFFDAGRRFRFVGVQCAEPFDELRVEFTNPADVAFSVDNLLAELDLRDRDRDGWPDFADPCPDVAAFGQLDSDADGVGDACDPYPLDAENDADGDGVGGSSDNCPLLYNPDQGDSDEDGLGDACDEFDVGADTDGDGVPDVEDNCDSTFNPEQADCDSDGVGDVCDASLINPASVELSLSPGQCQTITKSICLPPAPPVVDVVILFDTTGSMGGEIQALRQNMTSFVNGVRQALPLSNIRFGLAAIRDYPGTYASCNYVGQYSLATDKPFEVKAPIGVSDQQLLTAVDALRARGGQDHAEAYGRALWEATRDDSGLNFRTDAARFVVLLGDAPPHDCNLGAQIPSCIPPRLTRGRDPGRDQLLFTPDDIDFQRNALRSLLDTRTRLLMIFSGATGFCAWDSWCTATGGTALQASTNGALPAGANLVQELVELIRTPIVNQVTFAAENPCGLDLTFDPPVLSGPIDVSLGARVDILETICVPPGLPAGTTLDCSVRFFADDVLLGVQSVHVDVGCTEHTIDFETEDDGLTVLLNGQSIGTPGEFGRLVAISSTGANLGPATFDSTPGGPNDPSINSDMLIGHGNLLLLQDNGHAQQAGGVFATPTDDPDGGEIVFDFLAPADPHSLLLADINPPPNRGAGVKLVDENGLTRVYSIEPGWTGTYGVAGPHRLDLTTTAPQAGNGTPRWATAVEDPGFLQGRVVKIVVLMTGYGALDELIFCQ